MTTSSCTKQEATVQPQVLRLGLIAWLVRNSDDSRARDGVTLDFTICFALHTLTSLYGQFTDTSTSWHWVAAIIQGLLAAGFFVAARASMSQAKAKIT